MTFEKLDLVVKKAMATTIYHVCDRYRTSDYIFGNMKRVVIHEGVLLQSDQINYETVVDEIDYMCMKGLLKKRIGIGGITYRRVDGKVGELDTLFEESQGFIFERKSVSW